MTPHEREILSVVTEAAADVVAGFDRNEIPTNTGFAIAFQVALDLLERMEPELRRTIAASLIARLTTAQHLDA